MHFLLEGRDIYDIDRLTSALKPGCGPRYGVWRFRAETAPPHLSPLLNLVTQPATGSTWKDWISLLDIFDMPLLPWKTDLQDKWSLLRAQTGDRSISGRVWSLSCKIQTFAEMLGLF